MLIISPTIMRAYFLHSKFRQLRGNYISLGALSKYC